MRFFIMLACLITLCIFLSVQHVYPADWIIDGGGTVTINSNTSHAGNIFIEDGSTLRIENATLTMNLDYDEQYSIDVDETSQLVISNGTIKGNDYQYWIELWGDGTGNSLEVSGNSWITMHSGIRPFGNTKIKITGGDVEELQARDQVQISLENAEAYLVLFFDNQTAVLQDLDVETPITNTISLTNGWSVDLTTSTISGYQIDLMNNANVTVNSGDGIVLSIHTPGNLSDIRIVENLTEQSDGSTSNLGSTFVYSDCDLALINVYSFGNDKVLLRDMHVNEVNASGSSELRIGDENSSTTLNCNLCQAYDNATLSIRNVTIDSSDNIPSATASFHNDPYADGFGKINIYDTNVRSLCITAREHGEINLYQCQYDTSKIQALDTTASIKFFPPQGITGILNLILN